MRKGITIGAILVTLIMGLVVLANPIAATYVEGEVTIDKKADPWCDPNDPDPIQFTNEAVPVETEVVWRLYIGIWNGLQDTITNVRVKDRFGGELEVDYEPFAPFTNKGQITITTKGNSDKVFLDWYIESLNPGESCFLWVLISTDINPGGHQSYTSTGEYLWNSGSVIKYNDAAGVQHSVHTGQIWVTVVDVVPEVPDDGNGDVGDIGGFGLPAE